MGVYLYILSYVYWLTVLGGENYLLYVCIYVPLVCFKPTISDILTTIAANSL